VRSSRVHRVTITVPGTTARRVVDVPDTATLADLDAVIRAALGWAGTRPHTWSVDGQSPPEEAEDSWLVGALVGRRARYRYGPAWWHDVLVAPGHRPSALPYPLLLAADGAAPPEDGPGPEGYVAPHPDRPGLKEATERVAALQRQV
jgi:hypothetical protein